MSNIRRTHVNRAQLAQIYGLLSEHCSSEEVDGVKLAIYAEGYDDERLAEIVGCKASNVRGCREPAYGKLKPPPPKPSDADARIDELVRVCQREWDGLKQRAQDQGVVIAALKANQKWLQARLNSLEQQLGVEPQLPSFDQMLDMREADGVKLAAE